MMRAASDEDGSPAAPPIAGGAEVAAEGPVELLAFVVGTALVVA
jgi:hypothetical protein